MILAIAIVVDDAIVVVEGVHAKLDMGYTSARKASLDAMSELGGAILSITLVMWRCSSPSPSSAAQVVSSIASWYHNGPLPLPSPP